MMRREFEHYNHDVEAALLGIMLIETDKHLEIISGLKPEYFDSPKNKIVFEVMQGMWERGIQIDTLTVVHELGRNDDRIKAIVKGEHSIAYAVMEYTKDVVSSAHVRSWMLVLTQCYIARKKLELRQFALSDAIDDPLEFAQAANEAIRQAIEGTASDDWMDMSQAVIKLYAHMDKVRGKTMLGVPSGLTKLDAITGGFQGGQLIVVGARPSMGKSAFAATIAINAAKLGKKIGIISLEMPEEQVTGRMAAIYSDTEFWRIYRANFANNAKEDTLVGRLNEMANLPIFLSSKTNVDANAIKGKAMKLKNTRGLDMLIIDYLQLVETKSKAGENREREVAKLSRSLKMLAMEMDIPIVVLAQLNRANEASKSAKPKSSNLRESGAIEQDADMVALLHRDWKAGVYSNEDGSSTEFEADIILDKHRNGETDIIKVRYDGDKMRFSDMMAANSFVNDGFVADDFGQPQNLRAGFDDIVPF